MIQSLANLLDSLSAAINDKIKSLDVSHPTTIGSMYEGFTSEMLEMAVFDGMNLFVAKNSFIEGCQTEFDVILAEGEGEKLPFTDRYKFKADQVLAIIQVKKNLFSKDLADSYENLYQVPDLYVGKPVENYMAQLAQDAFITTCGKTLSAYKKGQLSTKEEYIYHSIVTESQLPLRIVIGYNGFKSEEHFRQSFIDYLNRKVSNDDESIRGYGPVNFPNLIICGDYSIIKLMGNPYNAPIPREFYPLWPFLGSTHHGKMIHFLEMLWTKLSYKYQLSSEIFGEDLNVGTISTLLVADLVVDENNKPKGWNYIEIDTTSKQLLDQPTDQEWEPCKLSKPQWVVLNALLSGEKCMLDEKLEDFARNCGYDSAKNLIDELNDMRLVVLDGGELELLTKQLRMVLINDTWYAGDDSTGRFSRWMMKHSTEILFNRKK
jgi:hypothetical protein